MLVLTRCEGEEVYIDTPAGERVVVKVCKVSGDKIRIGVDAPESFGVNRREIAEEIAYRKLAATTEKNIFSAGIIGRAAQ